MGVLFMGSLFYHGNHYFYILKQIKRSRKTLDNDDQIVKRFTNSRLFFII